MRWFTTTAIALLAALSIAACNSSSNTTSSSTDTSAATSSSDMSSNSAATAASTEPAASSADNSMGGGVPSYPGASTEASGSSMNMGSGSASGKVMSTTDSFDKVYSWYQKNMPAGSEKSHMTTPVQSAVFMVGDAGKDQQSVTISVSNGKTMITVAHVKQ